MTTTHEYRNYPLNIYYLRISFITTLLGKNLWGRNSIKSKQVQPLYKIMSFFF